MCKLLASIKQLQYTASVGDPSERYLTCLPDSSLVMHCKSKYLPKIRHDLCRSMSISATRMTRK